jgi:hypothetical protein
MNEMWKREEFLIANGMSQLPNSSMTNDLSPYDYFEGGLDVDVDRDFSDASGRRRRAKRRVNKPKRRGGKTGFEKVMSYTPMGMAKDGIDRFNSPESRQRREAKRGSRQNRKTQQTADQRKALADVSRSAENDAKLLAQLTQTPATLPTPQPTGMNKTTKTVLIVGGVAVAIVVSFMLYKKFKK